MRRWFFGLAALLLLLCGCDIQVGGAVEDRLRPPRVSGQEALLKVLDGYLPGGYLLTFPRSGELREAFLFEDMDGDGRQEAICFYRRPEENTHVLVLCRDGETWLPLYDVQGGSTDVDWVTWGRMIDGGKQLLVGWGIYNNSRDRQLVLYSLDARGFSSRFEAVCAAACMGDIMGTGRDSLMVFTIDSDKSSVNAAVYAYEQSGMVQQASVDLDGYIRSFGRPKLAQMAKGKYGVFVDGFKDAASITTELVYWENGHLNAPFYNPEANANTTTVREGQRTSTLTGGDVNGDGIWEWPQNRRLIGYQTVDVDKAQWLTIWMRFDPEDGMAYRTMYSLVNTRDRYQLMLDPDWVGASADGDGFTMKYDALKHLMEVYEVNSGVTGGVLLRVAPFSRGVENISGGEVIKAVLSDTEEYAIWYRSVGRNALTQEEVRYMLTPLP